MEIPIFGPLKANSIPRKELKLCTMKLETAMSLATWATENRTQVDFNAGNFNADCGFSDTKQCVYGPKTCH